jgi:hypothetical protein
MRAFVPPRVAGTVDGAVKQESWNRPKATSRPVSQEPAGAQGHEPQGEIGEAFSFTALHELL